MNRLAKVAVTAVFAVLSLAVFLNCTGAKEVGPKASLSASTPTPTPPAANTVTPPAAPAAGGKTIPKTFTLAKDSLSEYGEVAFNHDSHAFKPYSPDGKSVIGCVECHHTDQPKSALKAPLATSERDVTLTMEVYQTAAKGVSDCRACHFQEGNVPDGKSMPSATYTVGEKTTKKSLTNELAFHINCNTCHDAAFKARPELKQKTGFATSKDCTVCHKAN